MYEFKNGRIADDAEEPRGTAIEENAIMTGLAVEAEEMYIPLDEYKRMLTAEILLRVLLAADINALPLEDRVILDLTKYNAIMEQYNEYRATIDTEGQAVRQSLESSFANVGVLVAATATMLSAAAFVGMKNRLGF